MLGLSKAPTCGDDVNKAFGHLQHSSLASKLGLLEAPTCDDVKFISLG